LQNAKARFPPLSGQELQKKRRRSITLKTTVGNVTIETVYGRDPATGQWLSPIRVLWELAPHDMVSPVLKEKLCYTATMTNSYEKAASVATKWGTRVDDSAIHRYVQEAGQRAIEQEEERVERALSVETRAEVVAEAKADLPVEKFSLVIMMDGTMLRERGPDWGLKPSKTKANRVEWHELKGAIIYRLADRAETQSGRRIILQKYAVAYRGEPHEFGRRVYAEALRRGLAQAQWVYVIADGAVWIWKIVEDRFSNAIGGLDFYHAAQHLWAIAHDQFGEGSVPAREWVEPLLHQLKHGDEDRVLKTLEDLLTLCEQCSSEPSETLQREVEYFRSHREHIHYKRLHDRGCPIGSGAMESTCGQLQDRFKRTGQFWTLPGERCLMALELSNRNDSWDEIWPDAA
jgi:hypothetical protein